MSKWLPKPADYAATFRTQNPWQSLGVVPAELAPDTQRPLADVLWKTLLDTSSKRHQIILGPRRVGKTTVMYQTVRQLLNRKIVADRVWWLRLDHPLLIDWDLGDMVKQIIKISRATNDAPAYVLLDELTYAKKWDLWLKTFFDEKWPIRIVGTSSATAAVRQRGTESGVGRWHEQYLAPYLFTEYLDLKRITYSVSCEQSLGQTIARLIDQDMPFDALAESRRRFLLTGGFPELLLADRRPDEASELLRSQRVLRSDALEKALYKDIPQAFNIQDPTKLERLLYIVAGQMTGVVSPNTISAGLEMAAATVERYLAYLERAFIVFTLPNFSPSEEAVQKRGKKLYFVDGAVRNAALLRGIAPLSDPAEIGILVENMAASHLRALAYQEDVRLYHWRKKGAEVDLVYDHPDDPLAFEITASRSHGHKGIHAFHEAYPKFRGSSYIVGDFEKGTHPTLDQPGTLPLDLFFLAVGCQERHALESRVRVGLDDGDGQLLLF
ncbi:MAG: ATP-binding protein [Planctomycetia bacterium]|nr:ATP-binding protein [Planctomycetia bacterium]